MDARFQQFLYADTKHNFPLVESLPGQTIPRNTGLILMLLWPAFAALRRGKPASTRMRRPSFLVRMAVRPAIEDEQNSRRALTGNSLFAAFASVIGDRFLGKFPLDTELLDEQSRIHEE